MQLQPPPNGVNFFFSAIAPEKEAVSLTHEEREKRVSAYFEALGASKARVDTSRFVGMHKTRTVDYIILLSGEVDLLLDDGEVHLKPFDVVIQRGTNHGWVNRGTEPAIFAAVLIDAEPMGT
ncbi:MAG: cupin domain-containing protein [Acetobacteraceae bacterium]|nr:cupin domain-containing protein [Acetobacteraceae bacterium]